MTTIDLTTLIPRCHEAAKAKGFWDTERNAGEALMLVVSELGEALEAHRKGRHATINAVHVKQMAFFMADPNDVARNFFEQHVKDTVADELADAYIRLCDYAGGFHVKPEAIADHMELWKNRGLYREEPTGNFGADLVNAVIATIEIDNRRGESAVPRLSEAFATLQHIASHYSIDLATHIDLKLRYNATRPVRHGKNY